MCTIHPKYANYLLHCKSVTTCPNGNVTTCPNAISITKCVSVDKYSAGAYLHLATYIQGLVYSHNHESIIYIGLTMLSWCEFYKERFKKHIFSYTWRNYVAHGRSHVILHLTCLHVVNILPSCGNIRRGRVVRA